MTRLYLGAIGSYVNGWMSEKEGPDTAMAYGEVGITYRHTYHDSPPCPELTDVESTHPAARFIAANALKDITHFTFAICCTAESVERRSKKANNYEATGSAAKQADTKAYLCYA